MAVYYGELAVGENSFSPVPSDIQWNTDGIIIGFENADTLAMATGDSLVGFQCVINEEVVDVAAQIVNGNQVKLPVDATTVSEIRYAMFSLGYPENANLVNGGGLPAPAFAIANPGEYTTTKIAIKRSETSTSGWKSLGASAALPYHSYDGNAETYWNPQVSSFSEEPSITYYLNRAANIYGLSMHIDEDGKDSTPPMRFVDWPTKENAEATDVGLQALHTLANQYAMEIFEMLGETEMVQQCKEDAQKLQAWQLRIADAKQANALAVIAGLLDAGEANEKSLKIGGAEGLSSFMGYYILLARAMAGDVTGALDTIRQYWGGMLKLGATTFWEDFDIRWLENAAPIDRMPKEHEVDVHGTYGRHCYQGFRHSLCHGWASGPTSWLTRYVLGVEIMEPGCRKIRVSPNLCGLKWVRGTYPTPEGVLEIEHRAQENGGVKTVIHAPKGIEVIYGE